ncbi:Protein kish-A [Auxenochlorella protothecoides]|uniref:Protein kish-A n=1 Tax=Auxenochlorella protothecoides TaxID=3075 RepID=A0A087SID7_AUXPR|nr:Protein kish-A [Auxenochlorella protothecoides]KFM25491.1 Protein kish-A [Auxenochlorella protothecoides]
MSALFDFRAFCIVLLLAVCSCTFVKTKAPSVLSQKTGFRGLFWKFARVGERLSPWFCQLSRLTPWCAPSFDDSQDDDDLSNLSASSSSGSSVAPATEWEEETPVTRDDLSVPSERVLASRPSLLRASMSSPDLGRMLAPLVSPAVHRPRLKESALWRGPRPDAEAVQWRDVKGVRRLHSVHIFELIPEEASHCHEG